jgi:hypothetical protein|uniref:Uncharacterized protein n=1 Tax=Ackermannviridae sp. TaxID=2831612 RepID=A0A8S5VTW0_9CAUD|nr:MAG TPA: hypothetical protein [Ackermannviridae sp.]
MGLLKAMKEFVNNRKIVNTKRSYVSHEDLRYNPSHFHQIQEVTKYDIIPHNMVVIASHGTGYFVHHEDCHTYKATNTTCYEFMLENQYDGSFVDIVINYESHENGEGEIINISMAYEYDNESSIGNVSRDEAINFIASFLQKTLLL